ncbi:MAG: hypothetical protein M3545_17895, partial [Acidobacteriota bacterium]|nr:hypothetical protein [Acidobacteriota bacterium]
MALAGAALGLLIASYAVQFFAWMDPGVQLQTRLEAIRLDGLVVTYTLAIAVLTAVGCGIVPALRGSAAAPRANLFGSARTASPRRRWPHLFVAAEVAVSMVLLIASGLVGRTFLQMHLADAGFAADRVLGVRVALPEDRYQTPERRAAFFEELLRRVRRLPGVTAAGLGYGAMPPSDFVALGLFETADGRERVEDVQLSLSFVNHGHFELMGIPLLAGTGFNTMHPVQTGDSERPVVVSDSFRRRFWRRGNPLGEGFRLSDSRGTRRYRIVGIAADVSGRGIIRPTCEPCRWQLYLPLPDSRQHTEVLLRIADGAPAPVAALRATIGDIDPSVPSDDSLETGAGRLDGALAMPRFRAVLFGGFAALAVSLVAFGVLAVVFHAVRQRTREIGIRMALGAQRSTVQRMILREGAAMLAAGLALGLVLALATGRIVS